MSETKRLLIELKAKAADLNGVRRKLRALSAESVGKFTQADTYYSVAQGRLKLRELEGGDGAQLIYYFRPDEAGIKRSDVKILNVDDGAAAKDILGSLFGIQVVVRKVREIYLLEGTQVNLDDVEGLGSFVEFERIVEEDPLAIEHDRHALEDLMGRLGLDEGDLQALSYGDLLLAKLRRAD